MWCRLAKDARASIQLPWRSLLKTIDVRPWVAFAIVTNSTQTAFGKLWIFLYFACIFFNISTPSRTNANYAKICFSLDLQEKLLRYVFYPFSFSSALTLFSFSFYFSTYWLTLYFFFVFVNLGVKLRDPKRYLLTTQEISSLFSWCYLYSFMFSERVFVHSFSFSCINVS